MVDFFCKVYRMRSVETNNGAAGMARYKVEGYKKYTNKLQEEIFKDLTLAIHMALEMLDSNQYKVILIHCDSEGEDYMHNAGKFFLYRIIK